MHTSLRTAIGFGLITVVATLGVAPPAWSDDRRDDRRDNRHERRDERRDDRGARARDWQRQHDAARHQLELRRAADRHEWERRRELDRHRAAAHWRFERERGWRFENRPGVWSPFFVWWAIDGRPVLRPYPTARIVRYPTGYYELVGDGISTPYYWVWRPTVVVATPPPVPLPPLPPADYPFPPGGGYPPPPGYPSS